MWMNSEKSTYIWTGSHPSMYNQAASFKNKVRRHASTSTHCTKRQCSNNRVSRTFVFRSHPYTHLAVARFSYQQQVGDGESIKRHKYTSNKLFLKKVSVLRGSSCQAGVFSSLRFSKKVNCHDWTQAAYSSLIASAGCDAVALLPTCYRLWLLMTSLV